VVFVRKFFGGGDELCAVGVDVDEKRSKTDLKMAISDMKR